jgi:hypothetical protein
MEINMTATSELTTNPLEFLKRNFLTLSPSLDYPTGVMVKPSGTVTVKPKSQGSG